MIDDEHDDRVQSASGVVMDASPEWFKVEDDVQCRCCSRRRASGGDGAARWSFPSLTAPSLDRVRVRTVGHCGGDKTRIMSL